MAEKKKTQRDELLDYLRIHKRITRLEAFLELGIAELPARICELKKPKYGGHRFEEKRIPFITRSGKKSSYIEYTLVA